MADDSSKKEVIPKLPYGRGTISLMPDGKTYIYKKTVGGKRRSVYGDSVKEVMASMTLLEKDAKRQEKGRRQ